MRQLADRYDTLLIADEVAVGMGRTGKLWACEWEEVCPDFLCAGKGLSGGYLPLAATLTTRQVWNAFLGEYAESKSFFHGHTYGGNPLACAAALANFELFDEQQTLQNVMHQGEYLEECLRPLRAHPWVGDIRRVGLMLGVELVANKPMQAGFAWTERRGHQVCQAAMTKGVWLRPLGNVIVIMPPLCSTEEHMRLIAQALTFGVEQLYAKAR